MPLYTSFRFHSGYKRGFVFTNWRILLIRLYSIHWFPYNHPEKTFIYRKVGKGDPQMVSVFGVETSVVNEIDATSDDVARGEGGAVGLTRAG